MLDACKSKSTCMYRDLSDVSEFFVIEDDDSAGEAIEMDSGGESEDGDEAAPVGKKDAGRGGEQSGSTGAAGAVEDKVYVPGQPLDEGEELVHDSSAYCMYHAVSLSKCAELSGQKMR